MRHSFERVAVAIAHACESPVAFGLALAAVLAWAAAGPMFHYSEGWQMVVNTGTTIASFLMLFLLLTSQARDAAAVQAKLDELIRATESARDELIGAELRPAEAIAAMRVDPGEAV